MPDPAAPKASLRLDLKGIEAEVAFDEIRVAANTDTQLVILMTNQAGERVHVLLPKKTLKELVNWKTLWSSL